MVGEPPKEAYFVHLNLPVSLLPYCWVHRLDQGGGLLNSVFTHKLAQVLYATQGSVQAVAGEARLIGERAPVGPTIHDFRDIFGLMGTWNPAQASEWRPVDADMAYTVTAQIRMADDHIANVLFRGSVLGTGPQPEYLIFHGEAGSLFMSGSHGSDDQIQRFMLGQQSWEEVPIAQEVIATLPQTPDLVQRCWNQFFREFVADVNGETYSSYPTFRDGYTAVAIMDIARTGYDWRIL